MIKRAFGLIVCLVLLPGCIQISSGSSTLPTPAPTAVVPTAVPQPSATFPPAPETAVPLPTALPSPTSVISAKPSLPTASVALEPAEAATVEPVKTAVAGYTTAEIGYSVEGRPLTDYQFGSGPEHIVFIGGIHGGYEWNTILLAYDVIDYFTANPAVIPAGVTVHVIPSANPDGQYLITGQEGRFSALDVTADSLPGRVNSNDVDLNRNWDCKWTANAFWRDQPTSGGSQPFSEPEAIALRDFLLELDPLAVIFWHSAANGVFAAGCYQVHQPSLALATIYGRAAGYPVYETFTSYPVTGDAGDWLSLQGIPTASVELINHEDTDWAKNLAGVTAVLRQFNQISQ